MFGLSPKPTKSASDLLGQQQAQRYQQMMQSFQQQMAGATASGASFPAYAAKILNEEEREVEKAPSVGALGFSEMRRVLRLLWSQEGMAPALIVGPPGIGKSSLVRQVASDMALPCEVVVASLREPSDFAGLPIVVDGEVRLAAPNWARRLAGTAGVLFLDEINTAPPSVQAALLRVVLDRVVGDIELGPKVRVVAAMNGSDEAANGWELAAPMANRFYHFAMKGPTPTEWASYERGCDVVAESGFVVDEREYFKHWNELVEGTAQVGTALQGKSGSGAFATPRSWEMALRAAALCRAADVRQLEDVLVASAVGAGEAIAWKQAMSDGVEVMSWPKASVPADRAQRKLRRGVEEVVAKRASADEFWRFVNEALDKGHASVAFTTLGAAKAQLEKSVEVTDLGRATMARMKAMVEAPESSTAAKARLEERKRLLERRTTLGPDDNDIPFLRTSK